MTKLFKRMNILGSVSDSGKVNAESTVTTWILGQRPMMGNGMLFFSTGHSSAVSFGHRFRGSIMTHCLVAYTGRYSPSQERRAAASQQKTARHFRPRCYIHKASPPWCISLTGLLKSAVFSQPVLLSIVWILPSAKLENKHSILLTRKDIQWMQAVQLPRNMDGQGSAVDKAPAQCQGRPWNIFLHEPLLPMTHGLSEKTTLIQKHPQQGQSQPKWTLFPFGSICVW